LDFLPSAAIANPCGVNVRTIAVIAGIVPNGGKQKIATMNPIKKPAPYGGGRMLRRPVDLIYILDVKGYLPVAVTSHKKPFWRDGEGVLLGRERLRYMRQVSPFGNRSMGLETFLTSSTT
jgi:NADPH-dependent 2,4-dienoyl-CoA reductase/sulfur reductase-like enzyme